MIAPQRDSGVLARRFPLFHPHPALFAGALEIATRNVAARSQPWRTLTKPRRNQRAATNIVYRLNADLFIGSASLSEAWCGFARHRSPQVLVVASIALATARSVLGGWTLADAVLGICVLASWPVQERVFHEFLLHSKARKLLGRRVIRRISANHHEHHRNPWNVKTIFINPAAYAVFIPALLAVFFLVTGELSLALSASTAYLVALLWYELVHFLIHTRYVPRSAWYRRRWLNHRLHHFKNNRYWYGITTPIMDLALRSRPHPDAVVTRKDWQAPSNGAMSADQPFTT